MGVAKYFDLVLGADNVPRAKPDPDPVLMTLDKLSFKADETLVVGDMPVDIQMGLGAHAYTCGVPYGNASKEALAAAGAHAVIEHFSELEEVIAKF
jgi:phosphoglycolate phosphatase